MCGVDLHRHDQFSSFDGFGKAIELARLAKQQGITALGIANHGNMNGIIEHWTACLEEGIKPILGVEAYFQPKFNRKNPKRDSFHLCLFAQNLQGYKNLNRIMTYANVKQKYYKPLVDFDLLEKYSEGVICTSGCIASFISQLIAKGQEEVLHKALKKFISIFGKENFYMEIQPYKLAERDAGEKNLQERVNIKLIKLAKQYDLKMILTSDSHYGAKNDYDTYMKMHEIKSSDDFAGNTYTERYMPKQNDLAKRFMAMHGKDFKDAKAIAKKCIAGLKDIEEKVEMDILGQLQLELPKISDNSDKLLTHNVIKGLKDKGLYNKKYIKRCKQELEVILHHGFEDYFLIVQDYINYAKRNYHLVDKETADFWRKFIKDNNYPEKSIKVGPGRGSVCNSALAFALDITEVDAAYFNLDFTRFLRMDKKKLPDIDLDFETDRRDEVIAYIVKKYPGQAAQICSYGLYKVDNLLNDLAKVCGVGRDEYDEKGKVKFVVNTEELKELKQYVNSKIIDDDFNYNNISHEAKCRYYDKNYDNIVLHFSKMYRKVRYIGTHAAGVAVVGGNLLDYTSIEARGDKKKGTYKQATAYDLNNLEAINVIKFDTLGLRTLSITKELEEMTDECFTYEWVEDESLYDYFKEGKTDGIFQFEKGASKDILKTISADCFNDVAAASALNRPGPLSLRMHEQYGYNKENHEQSTEAWGKYTENTYGTIVYQEQTLMICRNIGLMEPAEADKVLKFMKGGNSEGLASAVEGRVKEERRLKNMFVIGAKQSVNMSKAEAEDLFEKLLTYTFNQGHAVGYGLVSLQQMYYKVKHPELFWYVTLKYSANESDLWRLKVEAVHEGNVILLPHINYGAQYSIVTIEGENALAEGLSDVKGVGPKAAIAIEQERLANGKYKSKDDFLERVDRRLVNTRVLRVLEENGALLFDKKTYFDRVKKYNSSLYSRGLSRR